MRNVFTVLFISLFTAILMTSCYPYQKIQMDSPAFIYGDHNSQETRLTLTGEYNRDKYSFQGSLTIGEDIKLDHVLFLHGASLISYEDAKRTSVGQVFFDHENLRISFEITDPALYKLITSESYDGKSKLVVSSPAMNMEEARKVNEELKQLKTPFEK